MTEAAIDPRARLRLWLNSPWAMVIVALAEPTRFPVAAMARARLDIKIDGEGEPEMILLTRGIVEGAREVEYMR